MNCYKCATPVPDNSRFCNSCGADLSGETAERTLAVEADPELRDKLQAELGAELIIEQELGRGGMAIVYLARDTHLGRKVAVKVLPPELSFGGGTGLAERFKREARTAATLDHPHIIPIHRVSTGGKLFWYVMKYVQGDSLEAVLKRDRTLSAERTVHIVGQVAEALDYAHRHNVVHRDVKPANVMLGEQDWVTVTDFGIAKALDTSSLTGSGSMIGTPFYMSPEQCSGSRKVSGASDQYALGVMTFQMLSGHVPFTGDSVVEIVKKHCTDPPPPLGVLRPGLPPRLVAVVERALAKSPDDRFPGVTDYAEALAAAAEGREPPAAPTAKPSARLSKTQVVARALRPTSRRSRLATIGTVAVLAVIAAAAFAVWEHRVATQHRAAVTPSPGTPTEAARSPIPATTPPAPPAAAPAAAETTSARPAVARLTLLGVPRGAIILRDGRAVRGSAMALEPGRRHIVNVTAPGLSPWADTLTPRAGEVLTRTVALAPFAQPTTPAPAAPAAAAQPQAPQAQGQAAPQQALRAPGQVQPAPSVPAVGYISVGSIPTSAILINGRSVEGNPVRHYQVPAGAVRVRFQVTDSQGVWVVDTSYVVATDSHRVVGYVRLRRP